MRPYWSLIGSGLLHVTLLWLLSGWINLTPNAPNQPKLGPTSFYVLPSVAEKTGQEKAAPVEKPSKEAEVVAQQIDVTPDPSPTQPKAQPKKSVIAQSQPQKLSRPAKPQKSRPKTPSVKKTTQADHKKAIKRQDNDGSEKGRESAHLSQAHSAEQQQHTEHIKAAYLERLQALIVRHRHYPRLSRKRGEEGLAMVAVKVMADGQFVDIQLSQSSDYQRLDQAALKTLRQIQGFEPLPKALNLTEWQITIPFVFKLHDG